MSVLSHFKFKGVISAVITPFKNGELDLVSYKRLIVDQLDKGINGFVVNGTTGESPNLTWDEVEQLFHATKKVADNSVPIIIGTGTNSTKTTIEKTKKAKALGADAALVVTPYYNKPPQRGMVQHFSAVADSSDLPLILYNVPGRTASNLEFGTIKELSQHPNIIGIKEASGNTDFGRQIVLANEGFVVGSGDDDTCMELAMIGGQSVISVVSQVIPKEMVTLFERAMKRERSALKDYERYRKLNSLLFVEANPIPVKMALHLMGLIDSPELRLPLVELAEKHKAELTKELKHLGVI